MSRLALDGVSKRYRLGVREVMALCEVSLQIEQGELVTVLGSRKAGCSTLLRVAAGLERPDAGSVQLDAKELGRRHTVLGRDIAYCRADFPAWEGQTVVDHVCTPLLAQGLSHAQARQAAETALARVSVGHAGGMHPSELDGRERVRVTLARSLAAAPRFLLVDDPTSGVGLLEVDGIVAMIASLAKEDRFGVLMTTHDAMCITGADQVLSLEGGRLRGEKAPPPAQVIPLRPGAGRAQTG